MQKTPEMRTCKNRALTALVSVWNLSKLKCVFKTFRFHSGYHWKSKGGYMFKLQCRWNCLNICIIYIYTYIYILLSLFDVIILD